MEQNEKRKLENLLLTMGLSKLDSPELIQEFAGLINRWPGDKHEFVRDLLNECDADRRYQMYVALRPHLKFAPLAFDQYELRIAEKAGRFVSQRRMRVEGEAPKPYSVGGHLYVDVPQSLATHAIATLTCHICKQQSQFAAATPAGAMTSARAAGWVRDAGVGKEICPNCPKTERRVMAPAVSLEMRP